MHIVHLKSLLLQIELLCCHVKIDDVPFFRSIVLSWLVLIAVSVLIAVLTKVITLEQASWSQRIAIAILIGFVPGLKASSMVSVK